MWHIPLDVPDAVAAPLAGLLDPAERARAALGRRPGMWRRFVVAHGAARAILGAELGRDPAELRWVRGRWGKPEIAGADGLYCNLSHSGEVGLLALSHAPVGVDVERVRQSAGASRIARRFFPAPERAAVLAAPDLPGPHGRAARFTALWTRKEACVKAAGGRLVQGLELPVLGAGFNPGSSFEVRAGSGTDGCGTDGCGTDGSGTDGRGLAGPWTVTDVAVPDGYAGALAVRGAPGDVGPVPVERWWDPGPYERPARAGASARAGSSAGP